jgi:hypothetical protein
MFHPSTEPTNPPVVIVEQPAALAQQAADSLRETATTGPLPTREEKVSAPVCAAGWAY